MVSGEYELDDNGENYKNLFDNTVAKTMFDVGTDFINEVADTASELDIDDKFYKLALLDYIGINRSFFVDLEDAKASFDTTKGLTINLKFARNNNYSVNFYDFGETSNAHVKKFLTEEEGGVYTPDEYMSTMQRLLRTNNFVSNVYSFDIGEDGGLSSLNQVFNPRYFYSTSGALNDKYQNKSGYISFTRTTPVENTSSPYYIPGLTQANGIYMFIAEGMKHSISPQVVYEDSSMEKFMHYPSLLKLLTKTQFFTRGVIEEFSKKYTNKSHCYILKDINLVKDFATNFSLDQSYEFKTCVPYALGVEVNPGNNDANTSIVFHYCFTYSGQKYDYLIPLFSFGETNNEYLDGFCDYIKINKKGEIQYESN